MVSQCVDLGRTKSLRPEGYLMVGIPGERSRSTMKHRLVYCEHNGLTLQDIAGQVIRHTCDNPRCINPQHLIIGSRADNNKDRADRNRSAKVVPSRQALTEQDVVFIKEHHVPRDKEYSQLALARRFGVDQKVIYNVLKGKYVCTKSYTSI